MIELLLPTYNSQRFLNRLLDSILAQTWQDWHLTVRDDVSTDETVHILQSYQAQYPDKISLLLGQEHMGVTPSFEILLKSSTAEYLMFVDQDDIWLENKIDVTLKQMQHQEKLYPGKPVMVCTDARCIDEEERILADSYFQRQRFIKGIENDATRLLALNVVQGCTVMINRQVLEHVHSIPKNQYHDKWLAVITAHYGTVSYLHQPTVLYRLHNSNTLGAERISVRYFLHKIARFNELISVYRTQLQELPFSVNLWKVMAYRLYYTLKRLFL